MIKILYERPLFSLLEKLFSYNVESITRVSKVKKSKLIGNPLQELVINMLLYNGCIIRKEIKNLKKIYEYQFGSQNIVYLYGKGHYTAESVFVSDSSGDCIISVGDILDTIATRPLIIVDLKYWDILLKEEQNRLINQLIFTLYAVRRYLWDLNIVLTNTPSDVIRKANVLFGINKVLKVNHGTEEFLRDVKVMYEKAVLLDPNAEEPLSPYDVFNADAFIIGGIVDRIIPRRGLTSTLVSDPNIRRRKIVFRGSIVGVPFSINKIVEIVLRSRYETCGNIDLAIRKSLSKRDIRWRIRYECRKLKKNKTVGESLKNLYRKIRTWFPIDFDEFKHICARS